MGEKMAACPYFFVFIFCFSSHRFRKMKILFINSRLSDRGGADRWLLGVLARLQGRAQTLLVFGYKDKAFPPEEEARIGPTIRVKGLDRGGLGRGASVAAINRLKDVLRSFRPSVVHVNDVVDPEVLKVAASTKRGVATIQDHRFFCPGRGKVKAHAVSCAKTMDKRCLCCFDDADRGLAMIELTRRRFEAASEMKRITVLSNYMAEELCALGMEKKRIEVIAPFVDGIEINKKPGTSRKHLFAGRLSWQKGVATALAAAELLSGDAELLIAGDGPMADFIAERAAKGKGNIKFIGWADRKTMTSLLTNACTLWMPGIWAEPFGIVGLEAMARGTPVIASDAGGISDWLLHGETGLLIPPGDAAALAEAANRLAMDSGLACRLAKNAINRAEHCYAPDKLMERLLDVYSKTAS